MVGPTKKHYSPKTGMPWLRPMDLFTYNVSTLDKTSI